MRYIFERVLCKRSFVIHSHSRVTLIGHGVLYRDSGSPLHTDHIIWATAAFARRAGLPLTDHAPQKISLALIGTCNKYAIASYVKLVLEGKWVWRRKNHSDRRFMTKYNRPPCNPR